MYEFHGWCALVESTADEDSDRLSEAVNKLDFFISDLQWANGFCELRPFNGEYFIHFGGFQNRPRKEAKDVSDLLSLVAREAPGSYGLLYWRDDEDPSPPGLDEWRVRVLARGMVQDRFDPFLSPSVPVTEDPYRQ